MIAQSPVFNEAALAGRRDFLDLGASHARIRVYEGARPAANGTPNGPMLIEIELAKPCGVVSGGVLTLAQSETNPVAVAGGTAVWGRIVNGNGDWAMDCDVSGLGGSGEIKLSNTTVFSGGTVVLASAVMG